MKSKPATPKVRTLKTGEKVCFIGAEIYLDTYNKLKERKVKVSAFIRDELKKAVA